MSAPGETAESPQFEVSGDLRANKKPMLRYERGRAMPLPTPARQMDTYPAASLTVSPAAGDTEADAGDWYNILWNGQTYVENITGTNSEMLTALGFHGYATQADALAAGWQSVNALQAVVIERHMRQQGGY